MLFIQSIGGVPTYDVLIEYELARCDLRPGEIIITPMQTTPVTVYSNLVVIRRNKYYVINKK